MPGQRDAGRRTCRTVPEGTSVTSPQGGVADFLAARAVIGRAMEHAFLDPGRRVCVQRLAGEC